MIQTGLDGILKYRCFVPGWICRFEIQILLRRQPGLSTESDGDPRSIGKTTALTLGFTWLNPHVYLDTVLLIGGGAVGLGGLGRVYFAIGAIAASFAFFFALGYGARSVSSWWHDPPHGDS